jgi:hypothetical protein
MNKDYRRPPRGSYPRLAIKLAAAGTHILVTETLSAQTQYFAGEPGGGVAA